MVEGAWEGKKTGLALLLDVKGAFDRVNKQRLLQRMVEVGIAGNVIRWVGSFLSDRRAMLVIDGRMGETHGIQAGLPQGSPASPVLFILSIEIRLVLHCDDLEEGIKELESTAGYALEWGAANQVEFEVSKTELLAFSKKPKVLRVAEEASIREKGRRSHQPGSNQVARLLDRPEAVLQDAF